MSYLSFLLLAAKFGLGTRLETGNSLWLIDQSQSHGLGYDAVIERGSHSFRPAVLSGFRLL